MAWSDYTVFRARRVTFFLETQAKRQKLNRTTPYNTVRLSFWCSTPLTADRSDEVVSNT